MSQGSILSVDDDTDLQFVLSEYFTEAGYHVSIAKTLSSALDVLEEKDVDLVLLDLTLPDGEGLTLIPKIKAKSSAGIIIVSGKNDTTEKIVCLEMGADDYITKPFEMRELSARIKAVARRRVEKEENTKSTDHKDKDADKVIFNGGWCLDRSQYQLYLPSGEPANLTSGEFSLLNVLIKSANRALTREQIFDYTHDDGNFDSYDRSIDIQIARLRRKMGDDQSDNPVIKTVRGVGYMFNAKIES